MKPMKFLFRADASINIGSGHIMRCLTLAKALRQHGHQIHFICRAHEGHLAQTIEQNGFSLTLLPNKKTPFSGSLKHAAWLSCSQEEDFADCLPTLLTFAPDWVIIDHYAISDVWEKSLQQALNSKIMVIDDLHDRNHLADLLLDQNHAHQAKDYHDKLPPYATLLTGTRYALLRPEFQHWRDTSLAHQDSMSGLCRILLNLGGVDQHNYTLQVLNALESCSGSLKKNMQVNVILGKTSPHINSIQRAAPHFSFDCRVWVNVPNMAQWMAKSDLAIGAAGSTSWERCCLGLPSILLILADNQRPIAQQLQQSGVAFCLETHELNADKLESFFRLPESVWQEQSQKARLLCDGKGVERIIHYLSIFPKENKSLRLATLNDAERLFQWRNHPDIRQWMLQQTPLIWSSHLDWLIKQLDNPDFILLIYQENGVALGSVNFKRQPENNNTWEWGFYLSPDCPKGHGTKMGQYALKWALTELHAQKIIGIVLPNNTRSQHVHRKLGFIEQARNPLTNTHEFHLTLSDFFNTSSNS